MTDRTLVQQALILGKEDVKTVDPHVRPVFCYSQGVSMDSCQGSESQALITFGLGGFSLA